MTAYLVRGGLCAVRALVGLRLGRRVVASAGAATMAAAVSAPTRMASPPRASARATVGVDSPLATAQAASVAPTAVETAPTAALGTPARDKADVRVTLLRTCAPAVDPATLVAVIDVESGGDPLAVNINGGPRVHPRTVEDAVAIAEAAIADGYSVDLGLMQVNSRNLDLLGTTVAAMFDPCTNVRAGATVLADAYTAAVRAYGEGQPALRAALSAYNTGDFARGFSNGYVARYFRDTSEPASEVAVSVPSIAAEHAGVGAVRPAEVDLSPNVAGEANPYTASPTVFTRSTWATTPLAAAPPSASARIATLP